MPISATFACINIPITIMQKVYILLFNGFSDWEIAFATPEIAKSICCELIYVSSNGEPVVSMGGMMVAPHTSIQKVDAADVDLLILPGGTAWERGENAFADSLVDAAIANHKPVAAICAATAYLAQRGYLNATAHTSNALLYLKAVVPSYTGDQHYVDSLAVTGNGIITANGIAPIEFAREIFRMLSLFSSADLERWYQLFKNGVWSE